LYNLLLLLRKDCLFCLQSECYGPPSPSISLESIKSLVSNLQIDPSDRVIFLILNPNLDSSACYRQ